MPLKMNLNFASVWTALVGTAVAMLWLFQNMAWAVDIARIEARLIRQDIRDLREELRHATDDQHRRHLEESLQEAIDELCEVVPEDRECK